MYVTRVSRKEIDIPSFLLFLNLKKNGTEKEIIHTFL